MLTMNIMQIVYTVDIIHDVYTVVQRDIFKLCGLIYRVIYIFALFMMDIK